MITLEHSLITLYAKDGRENDMAIEIPYVLLPDAIRKYSSLRQYGHFETNHANGLTSWLRYPINLKSFDKKEFERLPKYLAPGIISSTIGDDINTTAFEVNNNHLPVEEYFGIKKHLVQDKIFDEWIRKHIDCSKKDEDIFIFKGKTYTGEEIRRLITEIEYQGVYVLSYMNYKTYGITTSQEWFDNYVKKQLDAVYSEELSNATYGYMEIPEDINKRITEHDWSKIGEGIMPLQEYAKMYKKVAMEMLKIDAEKKKYMSKKYMDER